MTEKNEALSLAIMGKRHGNRPILLKLLNEGKIHADGNTFTLFLDRFSGLAELQDAVCLVGESFILLKKHKGEDGFLLRLRDSPSDLWTDQANGTLFAATEIFAKYHAIKVPNVQVET